MKTNKSYFLTNKNRYKRDGLQGSSLLVKLLLFGLFTLFTTNTTLWAQDEMIPPTWLFGISGGANFNWYHGTVQDISPELTTPNPMTHGFGVGGYGSILMEYRPNSVLGFMLNIAADSRYGILHYTDNPKGEAPAFINTGDLNSKFTYVSIEPSLRIAPWKRGFYFFVGPTFSFNVQKDYNFMQSEEPNIEGIWGNVNKFIFSGQIGAGYDIRLSSPYSTTYTELSPFISFLPYTSDDQMRNIEGLMLNTTRVGIALKFGCAHKAPVTPAAVAEPMPAPTPDVQFSFQPPSCIPMQRTIKETLPLRNYVFFDSAVAGIPTRYVQLTAAQAAGFKEETMQQSQSADNSARSSRQLELYHNILNIVGDRMRTNTTITITLIGSSAGQGAEKGKEMAETVKNYLVSTFGISGNRIATEGRSEPVIPSREPNTTKQFALVDAEDRRVDIMSKSPEIEMQYGDSSSMLKPAHLTDVNPDMLDTHIFFYAPGADTSMTSWSVKITDAKGNVQHYGPFVTDQADIPGKTITGNNLNNSSYHVVITGQMKSGKTITKEGTLNLTCKADPTSPGLRYSILFDFDKSKTAKTYADFLNNVVAPVIPDNSIVIIHGYTDIVGDDSYNLKLSENRAKDANEILETAVKNSGKTMVSFQTYWFGSNTADAQYGNALPEERFYNRTVVIDILPQTTLSVH